jgi:hypothetical protein
MSIQQIRSLILAGLFTGLVDGTFSSVLATFFYGSSVTRLFQGVASTLLGPSALSGGTKTAAIGIAMHFGVAFGWSFVFLLLARLPIIQRVLAAPWGIVKVASVYGPAIWLVMSLIVIPLLTRRFPPFTIRWVVQFVGHFPFVGLPIVYTISRFSK